MPTPYKTRPNLYPHPIPYIWPTGERPQPCILAPSQAPSAGGPRSPPGPADGSPSPRLSPGPGGIGHSPKGIGNRE